MQKIQDIGLTGEMRVLLRADFNTPMQAGKITDDTRIRAALPGIRRILETGASLIMVSHLGRPDANKPPAEQPQFSLAPIAGYLEQALGRPVELLPTPASVPPKGATAGSQKCCLLENIRFFPGETANSPELSKELGGLCDVFVMDAFGSAHRAHASTVGIVRFAPQSCVGILVQRETEALDKVLRNPPRPLVSVLGGAKVGDKLKVLGPLAEISDFLIVGGGIANTFMAAAGREVGNSLYEPELLEEARQLMKLTKIPLPTDVVVASSPNDAEGTHKHLAEVDKNEMILDIGGDTLVAYAKIIERAKTILWNGPVGVFEKEAFAAGTQELARMIAGSSAYTLAGGGDTIAAINAFVGEKAMDYISTGGGAFLEYIEKRGKLPALEMLRNSRPGSSAG